MVNDCRLLVVGLASMVRRKLCEEREDIRGSDETEREMEEKKHVCE